MKKAFFCILCLAALGTFVLSSCEPEIDDNNTQTTPTTPDTPTNPDNPVLCGETIGEWVDLGLPSGLLWYSVNIGATTPEGYGEHFAWGERHVKDTFSWATYIYGDYDSVTRTYTMYKYNTNESNGTIDNRTVLEALDDVATAVLGAGARTPTYDDWIELKNNTYGVWTEQNGVNGWKLTATNGQNLFLPAAGHLYDSRLGNAGCAGHYQSSSLATEYTDREMSITFDPYKLCKSDEPRRFGLSVRAVRDSQY